MPLSLPEFVTRWKASTLTERAAAQSHFIDLCDVLHQPHPAAADPTGETCTFEKHVSQTHGGKVFADVWKRGFFGWEYKGKHKDLKAAYLQLNDYREDLENPPLLVVCDQDLFEVHTNFTGTRPHTLDDLLTNEPTASCALLIDAGSVRGGARCRHGGGGRCSRLTCQGCSLTDSSLGVVEVVVGTVVGDVSRRVVGDGRGQGAGSKLIDARSVR